MLILILSSCGFFDVGNPIIEAHRGAAAHWPQNSASAMIGSINAGYDALELDLVLTSDLVPVLSHDAWLHEELCTYTDGTPLEERILIKDLLLSDVKNDYVCGGVPDPEQPDALVIAEPIMTFEELLFELQANSEILVHLDIKYEPGYTQEPDIFAEAILTQWLDYNLPNPYYISANIAEVVQSFESFGDSLGEDIPSSLIWPRFEPDGSDVATALKSEFATLTGVKELVDLIVEANSDGICVPYQVLDRRQAEVAKKEGYQVQVWTINNDSLMNQFLKWPIDSIITDNPELAE